MLPAPWNSVKTTRLKRITNIIIFSPAYYNYLSQETKESYILSHWESKLYLIFCVKEGEWADVVWKKTYHVDWCWGSCRYRAGCWSTCIVRATAARPLRLETKPVTIAWMSSGLKLTSQCRWSSHIGCWYWSSHWELPLGVGVLLMSISNFHACCHNTINSNHATITYLWLACFFWY